MCENLLCRRSVPRVHLHEPADEILVVLAHLTRGDKAERLHLVALVLQQPYDDLDRVLVDDFLVFS